MVYGLGSEPITVGRAPQCTIFLNDMTVSRMHAFTTTGSATSSVPPKPAHRRFHQMAMAWKKSGPRLLPCGIAR